MNMNSKKTILIDLDGVLNTYAGNFDENSIPPISQGAFDVIQQMSKNFKIKIFTSRNLLLTAKWIFHNRLENYVEDITCIKEPCFLIIDDRCINFRGDYHQLLNEIINFKPWYKNLFF